MTVQPLKEPNRSTEQLKSLVRSPKFWLISTVVVLLAWAMSTGAEDAISGAGLLIGGILVYFFPSLVARKKPNATSVFVINLFFGWTLIGWVIALSMASNKPQTVHVIQSSAIPQQTGRVCPFCAEQIQPAAVVCKHCGRDLPTV